MKPLLLTILMGLLCLPAAAIESAPLPDFSVSDINIGSDRRKVTSAPVSPRNYLNQVTGWYFGFEG